MSDMYASTGMTRTRPCETCGTAVEQRDTVGVWTGDHVWTTERHDAPCGLPCLGGGVSPRAYRERQVHLRDECPRCTP